MLRSNGNTDGAVESSSCHQQLLDDLLAVPQFKLGLLVGS
jgi:hypothetical protein